MRPITLLEDIPPIPGAAKYVAYDCDVYMITPEGDESCIQCCRSTWGARNAAVKWQKRENAAVLKSQKQKK